PNCWNSLHLGGWELPDPAGPLDGDAAPGFRSLAMLTLIDNYDSFTYNLVHYLGELGAESRVYRNDQVTVDQVMAERPAAILLSPGPCGPDAAGICLKPLRRAGPEIPLLGVCLGHQAIGQAYGGKVVRAPVLMHGKLSTIH